MPSQGIPNINTKSSNILVSEHMGGGMIVRIWDFNCSDWATWDPDGDQN